MASFKTIIVSGRPKESPIYAQIVSTRTSMGDIPEWATSDTPILFPMTMTKEKLTDIVEREWKVGSLDFTNYEVVEVEVTPK